MYISKLKIKQLRKFIFIIFISTFFTLIFSIKMLGNNTNVIFFGLTLGATLSLIISIFSIFILPKIQKLNFFTNIAIRTIYYFSAIVLASSAFLFLFHVTEARTSFKEIIIFWTSKKFLLGILFGFLLLFSISFFSAIIPLIGHNVFFKLIIGKYHKPQETEKVFMFIDMKSSTAIAEKIGNKNFLMLINDFLFDSSEAINETKGEIYKYVGDEIIIAWDLNKRITKGEPLSCFFRIIDKVKKEKNKYINKYGIFPEFKAGLHSGRVITGEIGLLKKEIAYMGDVLNTTSRIQSLCNKLNQNFIATEEILSKIILPNDIITKKIGTIKLRGKNNSIVLSAVKKTNQS